MYKLPVVLQKEAMDASRIFRAGMNRVNDLNREAIALRKSAPSTSTEFVNVFNKQKRLSDKVDKSIKQVSNIHGYAKTDDNRQAANILLNNLSGLKSRL